MPYVLKNNYINPIDIKIPDIWSLLINLIVIGLSIFFLQTGCTEKPSKSDIFSGKPDLTKKYSSENSTMDSIVHCLIDQCANRFYEDMQVIPLKYRHLELRLANNPNSGRNYLIYGNFLSKNKDNNLEWKSFAFVNSSEYLIINKNQIDIYFKNSQYVPIKTTNLSFELYRRVESLVNSTR